MFVLPSVVEQSVKLKWGLDLKNLPKTVSLEQVKTLVRELEQEDVCDMEVGLAEVRWQESDTEVLNAFAQDLETPVECLPTGKVKMRMWICVMTNTVMDLMLRNRAPIEEGDMMLNESRER